MPPSVQVTRNHNSKVCPINLYLPAAALVCLRCHGRVCHRWNSLTGDTRRGKSAAESCLITAAGLKLYISTPVAPLHSFPSVSPPLLFFVVFFPMFAVLFFFPFTHMTFTTGRAGRADSCLASCRQWQPRCEQARWCHVNEALIYSRPPVNIVTHIHSLKLRRPQIPELQQGCCSWVGWYKIN